MLVVEPRSSLAGRAQAQAEAYLERVAVRIREQGVQVGARVVVARHVVEAVVEEAAAHASDLIAVATHGRSGLQGVLLGSVAEKLVRADA